MSYETNMRGVLFRETEKKSEKAPDYTGNIEVNGVQYRLAGWIKDKNGRKFMSLAVSEKEAPKDTRTLAERKRPPVDDLSDVPF